MRKPHCHIMGKNCLIEVFNKAPERILEVYTTHKMGSDDLYNTLQEDSIHITQVNKDKLFTLTNSESHQGWVAKLQGRRYINAKDFLAENEEKETSLVVLLDSIFDPHNMGAIIRTAECFGVDLIVYSKNRGCEITPVVAKTSSGATELIQISKVSNLAETIKLFQKEGYWAVGAELSDKSQDLYSFDFPEKTLLVMGSEGKGLQPIVSKACDFHVSIEMLGQIDSLNVSQATAVILSGYRRTFNSKNQ